MARWFRSHAAKLNDPKVHRLTDRQYRAWDSFLCMAADNEGRLPLLPDAAFLLRKSEEETGLLIRELIDLGFLVRGRRGVEPHNWNKWQYKSDVSTGRVKQFRQRQRNVSVTPSEAESEAEADTEQTEAKASEGAPEEARHAKRPPAAHRLPEDWRPSPDLQRYAADHGLDPESTAAAFADWWHAENGGKAIKRDWDAAFRTWCRRQVERPAVRGGLGVRSATPGGDAGAFARAAARVGPDDPFQR